MSYLHKLNVFIKENGEKKPFILIITNPKKTPNADDYFCNIHAPKLFKSDISIYGVDAEQAKELAIKFVNRSLLDKQLFDQNDKPIQILKHLNKN